MFRLSEGGLEQKAPELTPELTALDVSIKVSSLSEKGYIRGLLWLSFTTVSLVVILAIFVHELFGPPNCMSSLRTFVTAEVLSWLSNGAYVQDSLGESYGISSLFTTFSVQRG